MEIAERTGKYQTVYPNKDGTKEINLPQMKFLKDPFIIKCFTESSLPRTPAGRIATVTEQVQAGMLTLKEGRRLMRFPDLEQNEKLSNASEERIFKYLDAIVESGKYTPPDAFMDLVLAEELRQKFFPEMTFTNVPAFYNKPDFIKTLANSIKKHLEGFEYDHLLFSYHGIPKRHIRKTDVTKSHCTIDNKCCVTASPAHEFCYRHQCYETTRQVVELLGIPEGKYSQTFQSRLAGDKWLTPYTDVEINLMPEKGIKKLAVVTPAFVSDCLETLEEIAMRANEEFIEHGGKEFFAVPCLNDDDEWCEVVANWVKDWAK
jgi:hypothetical protein